MLPLYDIPFAVLHNMHTAQNVSQHSEKHRNIRITVIQVLRHFGLYDPKNGLNISFLGSALVLLFCDQNTLIQLLMNT